MTRDDRTAPLLYVRDTPSRPHGPRLTVPNRKVVVAAFLSTLYALAYAQAVSAAGKDIRDYGPDWRTLLLFLTFSVVTLSYFVGRLAHFTDEPHLWSPGGVWVTDSILGLLEALAVILLGTFSAVGPSENAQFGFVQAYMVLLGIEVFWYFLHRLACRLARVRPTLFWQRPVQASLGLGWMGTVSWSFGSTYSLGATRLLLLWAMLDLVLNLVCDHHKLLAIPERPHSTMKRPLVDV